MLIERKKKMIEETKEMIEELSNGKGDENE